MTTPVNSMPEPHMTLDETNCCPSLIRIVQIVTDHLKWHATEDPDIWKAINDIRRLILGVFISTTLGAFAFIGTLIVLLIQFSAHAPK